MKSTRFVYDQLRDIYNLICEEEYKKNTPPSKPIKKLNFGKGRPVQPGRDVYADTNPNASRVRTHHKDWDEGYVAPTQTPKRKTLKQFREDAGDTATPTTTARDKKNLDFMKQVFLAGKNIEDFDDFIGFVEYLST